MQNVEETLVSVLSRKLLASDVPELPLNVAIENLAEAVTYMPC
jgi:hypothetical protein